MGKKKGGLYIGPAGWSYDDWEGIVYPKPKPRGFEALPYIAGYFNLVEVNSSFYRTPSPKTTEKWARQTGPFPGFKFTLKLFRRFTHETDTEFSASEASAYIDAMKPLADAGKLLAVLVQFPWYFEAGEAERGLVERIADAFRAHFPLALEVRHKSWLDEPVLDFLKERDFAFTNLDMPHSRTSIGPAEIVTARLAYVRLHGRNAAKWFDKNAAVYEKYDYYYTKPQLADWAERIKKMREEADEVVVVANNHFVGQAPANALSLAAALEGRKVPVPPELAAKYPDLTEIDSGEDPAPQGGLFG